MRQITAAIGLRKAAEDYQRRTLAEWAVKTQAMYTAATVPTEKGKKNKLLEAAAKISLFGKRRTDSKSNSKEPQPGSYERLMQVAGSMERPR